MLRQIFFTILLLTFASAEAFADHLLVAASEKWEWRADQLEPGDEIILMPGEHRPIRLRSVHGTAQRPIIIRTVAPDRPAVIRADREGIRLENCSHVVIRDVTIEGATINGITVCSGSREPQPAHIRIERVTVKNTGPKGRRHAIQLDSIVNVVVVHCQIEGWGGAGVDVTASSDVQIMDCRFTGTADHEQQAAIQVRGGSEKVRISGCSIVDSGLYSIVLGGARDPLLTVAGEPFSPELQPDPSDHYQAVGVEVKLCTIEGSACPVHFISADSCRVRNNTIVRPEAWVVAVDLAPLDVPLRPSRSLTFSANLIVWEPGAVSRLMQVGPRYAAGALALEENLWWSSESQDVLKALFAFPEAPVFPQLTTVAPELDEAHRPKNPLAEVFGAHAP